jgi:hypothetical protein
LAFSSSYFLDGTQAVTISAASATKSNDLITSQLICEAKLKCQRECK